MKKIRKLAKKGDRIVCKKGHLIAIMKIDVLNGDMVSAKSFDWKGEKSEDGKPAKPCKICGDIWWSNKEGIPTLLTEKKYLSKKILNSPHPLLH